MEGALTAALLARRGTNVLWLGQPPAAYETKDGSQLQTAPALAPSLTNQPALRAALGELAMELDSARQFQPVPLQLLGDRRRFTFPEDSPLISHAEAAFARISERLDAALEPSRAPTAFSPLGLRALARREEAFVSLGAELSSASPDVAELLAGLRLATGSGINGARTLIQLAAAPHRLDGGRPRLVEQLFKRFGELGGRTLPQALAAPARAFRIEFRGVRLVLSNGDQVSAPAMVLALSAAEREHLLPAPSGLFARGVAKGLAALPAEAALVRTRWVVADAGLPAPLGPVAVVAGSKDASGPPVVLLERQPLGKGLSEFSAHRLLHAPPPATRDLNASDILDRLRPVLPFFEGHVKQERTDVVPHHGVSEPLPVRFGRIHLALPGVAGLCGWDGAAQIAQAIAGRLASTQPRREVLPASVTQPPPVRSATKSATPPQAPSGATSTASSARSSAPAAATGSTASNGGSGASKVAERRKSKGPWAG